MLFLTYWGNCQGACLAKPPGRSGPGGSACATTGKVPLLVVWASCLYCTGCYMWGTFVWVSVCCLALGQLARDKVTSVFGHLWNASQRTDCGCQATRSQEAECGCMPISMPRGMHSASQHGDRCHSVAAVLTSVSVQYAKLGCVGAPWSYLALCPGHDVAMSELLLCCIAASLQHALIASGSQTQCIFARVYAFKAAGSRFLLQLDPQLFWSALPQLVLARFFCRLYCVDARSNCVPSGVQPVQPNLRRSGCAVGTTQRLSIAGVVRMTGGLSACCQLSCVADLVVCWL
jgi:hypothetical protein